MTSEDKLFVQKNDLPTDRALLYGMGDQHLDIIVNKLKDRYKVDIELPSQRFRSARPSARVLM